MEDFEKLGAFYLGRPYDLASGKPGEGSLLYDAKDLTTHGMCVGMTGSGKTGLCIAMLEEAAIDGIPAIVIDPKGDMANLLLSFPDLLSSDFQPWVDEGEARRKEISTEEYAGQQAAKWKEGLADWGQDGDRIRKMQERVDFALYTPGSTAARPISILRSFSSPPNEIREDPEMLREQAAGTAASLLGLVGENTDPVQSRAHILLTKLLLDRWAEGGDLDLAGVIRLIQQPPFKQVGVMDLESFYPSSDRFSLAIKMNNLLASPTFAAWMEGEPLDVGRMLHTADGRPRITILSIAHLGDAERMFFVSLLLNQVVSWMRTQTGTNSLRAILYMDEIHGFFPPVANPPSKPPMLTLLRQARAFGLGVMLTTQNPVDLDYKGLSNTGTWFIGRLQTERDKARVLEGLEGASLAQGAAFDRSRTERILAGLGSRVFLMHNVHDDEPTIFETRWCMSYLRGPLTRTDFARLRDIRPEAFASSSETAPVRQEQETKQVVAPSAEPTAVPTAVVSDVPPAVAVVPSGIHQVYFPVRGRMDGGSMLYRPALLGIASIGFRDSRSGIQASNDLVAMTLLADGLLPADWEAAQILDLTVEDLDSSAREGIPFAPLPSAASQMKNYTGWSRDFEDWIYRTQSLDLYEAPLVKEVSQPDETEGDFRIRIRLKARERKDAETEALRKKYAAKVTSLEERIRKAEQAVDREKDQAKQQKMQTAISFGATLLSSFLGKKKVSASSVGKATTAIRGASRALKESGDVARSKETVESLNAQLEKLEEEFRADTESLATRFDPDQQALETVSLRPLKQNIQIRVMTLAWLPCKVDAGGIETPAWV
ncbi:MAG: ATP-binding protein [Clostridiaceae bacterium]|nr:ATP-binding protein [Clostridiaceae bacterium]